MSHTIYAAKFEQTIIHQHVHLPRENQSHDLRTYRNLKEKYETDTYLFLDIDKTLIKQFTQIKISNSKFMIELGRHNTTDINNRICPLCKNGVEDEYHLIILCSSLNNIRNKMLANILSLFLSFHVLTDENKFLYFFQCEECVDNLLTMSVHDDGYYRNSPC
jgi:hypothetical protein